MPDDMLLTLLLFGVAASIWDVRKRIIPNLLVLAYLIVLIGLLLFRQLNAEEVVISGLITAAIYLALFLLGVVGGGDVKMMSVGSMAVPPFALPEFLLCTALCGAGFGLIFSVLRGRGGDIIKDVFFLPKRLVQTVKRSHRKSGMTSNDQMVGFDGHIITDRIEPVTAPFAPGLLIGTVVIFGLPWVGGGIF